MKKVIISLMLCIVSTMSFAQLKVNSEYDGSKTEEICLLFTYQWAKYNPEIGFWISSKTSNQFDNMVSFYLGVDKESAIETVNQLISLINEKEEGYAISVTDCKNQHHTIIVVVEPLSGNNWLEIKTDGYAGEYWFRPKTIKRCLDFLNNQ